MQLLEKTAKPTLQGRDVVSRAAPPDRGVEPSARNSAQFLLRSATCVCGGGCPDCKGKGNLSISQPNDPAEIEADATADQVMRMPATETAGKENNSASPRKTSRADIQRKQLSPAASPSLQTPDHVSNVVRSGGVALDGSTRNFFEPRLGFDLSGVRIHTGPAADRSARNLDAKAYTIGHDIVFAGNQYEPTEASGKHLLAHELAHVVQDNPSQGRIHRKPGDQICVPGAPADSAACVEARQRDQKAAEDRKKPGTTIVITDPNMSFQAGVGLRVPPHPDAVKGIHDWTNVYATANSAKNHNKFTVGSFRVQQICQPDITGAWSVYVYFVTDADGDDYAVGPDSFASFVISHGMTVTADASNTDELGGGKKMLDPRKLPAAPDAFTEEPTIHYAAPRLPPYDEMSDAFHVGYYSIRGYLRRNPDGSLGVLYYEARNMVSLLRPEYIIGPGWIDTFIEKQGGFGLIAEFSYPMEPGAMPAAYQIHSARFVMGAMKGDVERAESGTEAWKSAAKDPGWWLQVAMGYAGAGQPATPTPRPPGPPIRGVIQGGGGSVSAPPVVSGPVTGAPALATRGNTALALDRAPVTASIAAPRHLQSVPMPSGPPAPVPTPMSGLQASIGLGASSSLGTSLALGPDVDFDFDKRSRRGACSYEAIGQQFGRYPCHAAYATSLSGVTREVRTVTPELESADFDAVDHGGTLYEVKTGYRWMVFAGSNEARQRIINRFYVQATNQLLVAGRCGRPLHWYFNDPYVASFFGAENAPYPNYIEPAAGLPVPVWYVPFNCDQDSDG